MLRYIVILLGALLVAAGLALLLFAGAAGGLLPLGMGVVLLLALVIERSHYKQVVDRAPGPDWLPTGERFLEPGSDAPVAVYYHRASGKRLYVRVAVGQAKP